MLRAVFTFLLVPSIALADCTMTLVNAYDLPVNAVRMAIEDDHAYLGCLTNGMYVVDISDLSAPFVAGTLDVYTNALEIRNDVLYIAGDGCLLCVDVSDPANPAVLGEVDLLFGEGANDIALNGDHAFLATNPGYLMVVNIQDPHHPAVVGWWTASESLEGVAIQADRAYVAEFYYGLGVLDISTPRSPQLLGRETPHLAAYDVAVRGDIACVADPHLDGFRVIDVSEPSNLVTLGVLPDEAGGFQSLAMHGNVAYLTSTLGFVAIDLTDPANPAVADSYSTFPPNHSVIIRENLGFILTTGIARLYILDISDCNRAINCPADIDGNGQVDPFDSNACIARFGCSVGGGDDLCDRCDLDGNGVVNPFDSNAVMAAFGECPGES